MPSPEPAPTAVKPEPQKIKIRGKEYTFQEVLENEVLQQALLQTYEQFPTLQKKYIEMLEQQRQQEQTPPQPQQPIDPRAHQAQLVAHYAPQINEAVKNGWIEEDFAQLYPNAVAQMLWHRDQMYDLNRRFGSFSELHTGQTRKAEANGHKTQLTATLDTLAGSGDFFKPLLDAEKRQGFLDFLIESGNPLVTQLTPDYLKRQWVAFNHETVLTAAQATAERERIERQNQRLRAGSDGKGSRPTPAPAAEATLLQTLTEDFLPRR